MIRILPRILAPPLVLLLGCRAEVPTGPQDPAFQERVLQSDEPVLVDFYATWCAPCRMMNPIVEQLEAEYAGRAGVYKVDIDQYPGTAAKYDVGNIPAFLVFDDGEVVDRVVGGTDKADLAARLEAAID